MTTTVDLDAVQNLLAGWWFDYDQADFEAWPRYFTADAHFSCRSDSGATDFEDFIRADVQGRDTVVAWQAAHRRQSPYPLRHFTTNLHLTPHRPDAGEADFRSYLFCTHVVDGNIANLASGRVVGTARIDDDGSGTARFADLRVVLDFTDSVPFVDATLFPPA